MTQLLSHTIFTKLKLIKEIKKTTMKKIIFNNKIFVGLVAFFLATTAQIGAKELPSLVLYFDSVKGAKIEDLSGKDNHGKIVGKPKIVDSKFGKTIEMTGGDDQVEVPHSDSLVLEKGARANLSEKEKRGLSYSVQRKYHLLLVEESRDLNMCSKVLLMK